MDFSTLLTRAGVYDPLGYAAALSAGLASSVGPCAAPRYLMLASYATSGRGSQVWLRSGALSMGILAAYSLFVFAGSLAAQLAAGSRIVYWILGGFLFLGAVRMLIGDAAHERCRIDLARPSAAFLFGATSSIVMAPCCAPVLLAIGGLAAGGRSLASIGMLAGAFAIGHLAPVALALPLGIYVKRVVHRFASAVETVNAGVMMALALYYMVLA